MPDIEPKENVLLSEAELISFLNLTGPQKEMIREWRNHEDVRKWMIHDHLISKEEHEKFIHGLGTGRANFYWLVKNKQDEFVGVFYLQRVDYGNKNAYIGFYADPFNKAMGIGILLDGIAQEIAFKIMQMHTIKLEVIEGNKSVLYMHKKTGFQEEGRLREFVLRQGVYQDIIIMGMVKK